MSGCLGAAPTGGLLILCLYRTVLLRSGGPLAGVLSVLRQAADGSRAELQVWSYAWLAIPLLAQFLTA